MGRWRWSDGVAATGLVSALCAAQPTSGRNVVAQTHRPGARDAALTRTLETLEGGSYAAWKARDVAFPLRFLSDRFVGWGPAGRLDKTSAARAFAGANCRIASVSISDPQLSRLSGDVAVLTHRTAVDGLCLGVRLPGASRTATGYLREGGRWRAVFRAETPIVDPAQMGAAQRLPATAATPSEPDAAAQGLVQQERAIWTAWMDHDARRLDALLPTRVQFIDIFGNHLATKAQALKTWSGEGCQVKSFDLADARATMLTPDVAILTTRASADGACYGQRVGPVWGSTFYVRRGGVWVWSFGINVPAKAGA